MNKTQTQPPRPATWLTDDQVNSIWTEYQRTHDVSQLHGKAYGIDLETGVVYFGDTKYEIDDQIKAAGKYPRPLFLSRVGLGYYSHIRPGRRCLPE